MQTPTVVFVPLPYHLRFLYESFCEIADCQAFVDEGLFKTHPCYRSNMIASEMPAFGLYTIKKLLKTETQMPMYIKQFSEHVERLQPNYLICFDFYHWYFLQSVRYAQKHKNCKIVLYSETKHWPNNWVARTLMHCFLWYVRRNLSSIDRVLVYTEEGKLWWNKYVPHAPVSILPAPVDVTLFQPALSKDWLPNGTLRILMNARYNVYKRHEDLLQAAVLLRKQNRQFHITFIGRPDVSSERIKQLVAQFDLLDVVTFLDPLSLEEMPALYHSHDVLVLPSYNEAIGMVVPEAMACGLPTITSDTVGANVYVEAGETGWMYQTGDVMALATALGHCFVVRVLQACGKRARKRVVTEFTIPIVATGLLAHLRERF